ncbi:MAG: tyrosine-type recombinase/integrase [Gemmataceae bacterium]
MAWQRNYVTLPTGERIRYALVERSDGESPCYYVRFQAPTGKRVFRSTDQSKKAQANEAAQEKILEEYGQKQPLKPQRHEGVEWEQAEDQLKHSMEADGRRPRTIKGYIETLTRFKGLFPSRGPAEVTEDDAERFKEKYQAKPKSLDSRLRTLKAVFKRFKELHITKENPFEDVAQPKLDRPQVKYVKTADLKHFYNWLEERFPDWEMPKLFFEVKALTACRLADLCGIKSDQLQDGRLVFAAEQTKNRSERHAILPKDIYKALTKYAGPTYIWERYPQEMIEANKERGARTNRVITEFSPDRLYWWIQHTMQAYEEETGRDLSSHDFRRAAFTRAAEADINTKRAGAAFGVSPETMQRYYIATDQKRTSDEVLGGMAEKLRLNGKSNGRSR